MRSIPAYHNSIHTRSYGLITLVLTRVGQLVAASSDYLKDRHAAQVRPHLQFLHEA
jgi:hypothetical protein